MLINWADYSLSWSRKQPKSHYTNQLISRPYSKGRTLIDPFLKTKLVWLNPHHTPTSRKVAEILTVHASMHTENANRHMNDMIGGRIRASHNTKITKRGSVWLVFNPCQLAAVLGDRVTSMESKINGAPERLQ